MDTIKVTGEQMFSETGRNVAFKLIILAKTQFNVKLWRSWSLFRVKEDHEML